MKAHSGQVAIYLALVLVAVCILVAMNVGTFLVVRAKNRTMNAGDAAALAVAERQGELLRSIGELNVEHLKLLLACKNVPGEHPQDTLRRKDECREKCRKLEESQARLCFLGPLDGIRVGNEYAKRNGIPQSDDMLDVLKQHVIDVRTMYTANPSIYPEPWEGAWEEYAEQLELAIGGGILAGPDNIDFVDAKEGHILLMPQFYNAIAGRNWCWFYFNAEGLLESYSGLGDWGPLPSAEDELRRRRCANCEVYSLHLASRSGGALMLFGREVIKRLTGATDFEIEESLMINDSEQVWYCYGDEWDAWSTYPRINFRPDEFPIVGEVKREYDVYGAAVICRVYDSIPDVVGEGENRKTVWTAGAKPFATEVNLDGDVDVVTCMRHLVTPVDWKARLVPVDSVGGRDLATADPIWIEHVREHLPIYIQAGPDACPSCYYCNQLRQWERKSLREEARNWLKVNSGSCVRSYGSGDDRGGTPHGH